MSSASGVGALPPDPTAVVDKNGGRGPWPRGPICHRYGSGSGEPFKNFTPRVISPQRLKIEILNFVHGSAMQSLSLVMSECFLSGRGQGHVSIFYIVDFENVAIASRRYTGDIHNSTVVGLFMTHCLQLNLQLHTISLVRTCRISIFCTVSW